MNLIEGKSVIVFDEVQMQPLARQAIKHLVKDRRYDYIETGSLLSIKKNIKDIVIPSEETRFQLYPLDYEEFRWALGDTVTMPLLLTAYAKMLPVGEDVNRRLLRDFRLYMLVGGMPQAVDAYIETNNLSMVDQIKRNILELYEDDFRKIDPSGRAGMLFDAIPAELNKNASRYQVSSVIAGEKEERVREILADMQDSMTVYISYHADDPSVGMSLHKDPRRYKLFLGDTGLFVTLAFKVASRVLLLSRANAKWIYNLFHFEQVGTDEQRVRIAMTCRAASVSDAYWLRFDDDEDITWSKVDVKQNPLNEIVAQVALHGKSLTLQGSPVTPELTTNGAYAKAWRRLTGMEFISYCNVNGI